ncbi:MAG: TIGR01906 family membrane protein [Dehalococcoidales bacterium]|nr:MAG: TIGR01906 family membrane protein [Dehalococcoidales bacterium]
MKWKVVNIIARVIFILCILFLLLTAAIAIAFNSVSLYEYGFDKYDVVTTTGLARTELVKSAETLISYFNSGEEYIDLTVEKDSVEFELFTREESIHMKDVKGLVRLDYGVLIGTFTYVLAYTVIYLYWRKAGRLVTWNLLIGSGVTLVLILALWLGSLWNFDRLFYQFHLIAFSNDFWSAKGYMLKLFPGDFWYDAVIFVVIGMAAAAVLLGTVAGSFLFFTKKGLHFRR